MLSCGGAGDEDVGLRRGFEDAGGKDRQKVGHDALPVDLAQTADDYFDRDPLNVKGQRVANANAQGGGDACFQGDVEGVACGLAAPRAGDDFFGVGERIAIGRAVLVPQGPIAASASVSGGIAEYDAGGLAFDAVDVHGDDGHLLQQR